MKNVVSPFTGFVSNLTEIISGVLPHKCGVPQIGIGFFSVDRDRLFAKTQSKKTTTIVVNKPKHLFIIYQV